MKYLLTLLFLLSACSSDTKSDDNNGVPGNNTNIDYCERFGWYNDGRCDTDCDKPDPDCRNGMPTCQTNPTPFSQVDPSCDAANFRCEDGQEYYEDDCGICGCVGEQPTCEPNPDVFYVDPDECDGFQSSGTCAPGSAPYADECGCGCIDLNSCELKPGAEYVQFGSCDNIDFSCDTDMVAFTDDCGCGCQPAPNQCDYGNPEIVWFGQDAETCSQEIARPPCPEGTFPFENDCGCGCAPDLRCTSDGDCPRGFCEMQLEEPVCVYSNNCWDQEPILCDAEPPVCGAGEVASAADGCWGPCVSARTCEYVCDSDRDCRRQGLGRTCVAPDCPDVVGAVCENFCR